MSTYYNIEDTRSSLSSTIAEKIKGFLKSDREKVSEILSLLLSRKIVSPETVSKLLEFYGKSRDNRQKFFQVLFEFSPDQVDWIHNQVYAATDSPLWSVQVAEDIEKERSETDESIRLDPAGLKRLRRYMRDYLGKVFNLQYLSLKEYNADNTPINLLKYIAENEGVHPAEHWSAFEERLASPDRLLLGLEHFKVPNTPVVYIEIALSRGLIKSIHNVLGEEKVSTDPQRADTAIFYSVNNTYPGLAGIGLGEKMIVRAKQYLRTRFGKLRQFATLSPVPGFRKFLQEVIERDSEGYFLKKRDMERRKNGFFSADSMRKIAEVYGDSDPYGKERSPAEYFLEVLSRDDWYDRPEIYKYLEKPLLKLAKHYLLVEKRRDKQTGEPFYNALDPVANFHLSNGAALGSINFRGNLFLIGRSQSFGMMVNYIYDVSRLEENKIRYTRGEIDNRV